MNSVLEPIVVSSSNSPTSRNLKNVPLLLLKYLVENGVMDMLGKSSFLHSIIYIGQLGPPKGIHVFEDVNILTQVVFQVNLAIILYSISIQKVPI